jgi:hypothetical protein
MTLEEIPVRPVFWRPSYRIIPSRFPTVHLFDRVADPADLEAVFAVEALTNDRLREEVGEIRLVAPADRVSGPGTSPIMAAFTRLNPLGSRFSDGSYGVYYCAHRLETAIAETVHHRSRFLAATAEPPMEIDMRVLLANLRAELHELRGLGRSLPEVYDPGSYAAGQALGRRLRGQGAWGVAYDSVRHRRGECAAVFRPRALGPARTGMHLCYVWDGSAIVQVYEKRLLT